MKIKRIAIAAAVASLFSTVAFAGLGASTVQGKFLEEGNNASGILNSGHPHTYVLELGRASTVKIQSEHFPGVNHALQHMNAQLLNASGDVLVESRSIGGDFTIVEQLQPGQYRLVVSGSSGGFGDSWDVHRYNLNVSTQ
ncbi:hypothetical protein ACUY1T_11680 [Billgrantia sp. Q4P2]|uniref:hypothetical protein n=1 Tax=Billgrantia sp. Q4P2 TaxID=3463857 RepID=UPI0040569876